MANKRHKPEEIVTKLRQVDVLVGQGMVRVDAIRQVSITEAEVQSIYVCCWGWSGQKLVTVFSAAVDPKQTSTADDQ